MRDTSEYLNYGGIEECADFKAAMLELETGLVFMVTLYSSSRMGVGIPAILVNISGIAGAAATRLDGYRVKEQVLWDQDGVQSRDWHGHPVVRVFGLARCRKSCLI